MVNVLKEMNSPAFRDWFYDHGLVYGHGDGDHPLFCEGLNLSYSSVAFYRNVYNILAIILLPFWKTDGISSEAFCDHIARQCCLYVSTHSDGGGRFRFS